MLRSNVFFSKAALAAGCRCGTNSRVSGKKNGGSVLANVPPCGFKLQPGLEDELQAQLQDARVMGAARMQKVLVETTRVAR